MICLSFVSCIVLSVRSLVLVSFVIYIFRAFLLHFCTPLFNVVLSVLFSPSLFMYFCLSLTYSIISDVLSFFILLLLLIDLFRSFISLLLFHVMFVYCLSLCSFRVLSCLSLSSFRSILIFCIISIHIYIYVYIYIYIYIYLFIYLCLCFAIIAFSCLFDVLYFCIPTFFLDVFRSLFIPRVLLFPPLCLCLFALSFLLCYVSSLNFLSSPIFSLFLSLALSFSLLFHYLFVSYRFVSILFRSLAVCLSLCFCLSFIRCLFLVFRSVLISFRLSLSLSLVCSILLVCWFIVFCSLPFSYLLFPSLLFCHSFIRLNVCTYLFIFVSFLSLSCVQHFLSALIPLCLAPSLCFLLFVFHLLLFVSWPRLSVPPPSFAILLFRSFLSALAFSFCHFFMLRLNVCILFLSLYLVRSFFLFACSFCIFFLYFFPFSLHVTFFYVLSALSSFLHFSLCCLYLCAFFLSLFLSLFISLLSSFILPLSLSLLALSLYLSRCLCFVIIFQKYFLLRSRIGC